MKRLLSSAMILTIGVGMASQGWAQVKMTEKAIPAEAVTNNPTPAPAQPTATPAPAPTATPAPPTERMDEVTEMFRKQVGEDHFLPVMAQRMAVTNTSVITATQLPDRSGILVTAKGRGTSDLRIWEPSGDMLVYRFQVSGADLGEELKGLQGLLAEVPTVTAKRVGDHIVINGTLLSPEDERKYDAIIKRFDVLDMVDRRYNSVDQQRRAQIVEEMLRERGLNNVQVHLIQKGPDESVLYLRGNVNRPEEREQADAVAGLVFDRVVNEVDIITQLVELDVVMITVDYNRIDTRGQNLFNQLNQVRFDVGVFDEDGLLDTPGLGGGSGEAGLRGEEWAYTWIPSGSILATLQAAKDKTYVSYYAEPFLTVKNGETGVFQDGGTSYVALASEDSVGVAEIESGIQVSVTPMIQRDGSILVDLDVDVSVASENVPSFEGAGVAGTLNLKRARTETQVEMKEGETIVISGSNSNLFRNELNETPILGDIPVINLFFKSKNRNDTNIRSFFFITPRLAGTKYDTAEEPFSRQGPQAKEFYYLDSHERPSDLKYWLGWEQDIPNPIAEPTPLPENAFFSTGDTTNIND